MEGLFGASWAVWAASWPVLGPSWASWSAHWASRGPLGPSSGPLGALMARLGALFRFATCPTARCCGSARARSYATCASACVCASRPERHLSMPLKTPPGGGRVEPVREPQPAFAHSSTMRRSAGASRCHTYFSRNGRGRRERTNRSAICSARQGVGARLHCHRCGSRVPSGECNLVLYRVPEPASCGALGGFGTARTAWFGPDGATRSLG